MHRDISIGNVLKLVNVTDRPKFSVRYGLEDFLRRHATTVPPGPVQNSPSGNAENEWDKLYAIAGDDPVLKSLVDTAKELESVLDELDVSTQCKAIICDGDMAAYIPDYFEHSHNSGELSASLILYAPYPHF